MELIAENETFEVEQAFVRRVAIVAVSALNVNEAMLAKKLE
ncbi:MAG: hypothetical protein AAF629_20650 [Chloroflexota bacterium]